MMEFRCRDCQVPIVVEVSARDKPVVCRNCNLRQMPAGGSKYDDTAAVFEQHRQALPESPGYVVLAMAAGLFFFLGAIAIGVGIAQVLAFPLPAAACLVAGASQVGLGFAMVQLRATAIDVWNLRRGARNAGV